jgi:F420-dependent oxidoreductase-like protein
MATPRVRFGIQTPQEGTTYEGLQAHWREADTLGYDSIFIDDHFYAVVRPQGEPQMEAWMLLAALARETQRINVGILVGCNSYRAPALVAKMAATVDVISGGRLIHGLGAGWYAAEYEGYGYDFPDIGVRLAQLDESLRIQKLLWTEERPSFTGRHYRIHEAWCSPKPVQQPRPPIMIGGGGEKVLLRLVARHADIWNNGGDLDEFRHKLAVLREHCVREKRDPSTIEKSWFGNVIIDADAARARARLERVAAAWGMTPEKMEGRALAGTPERIVERVREYVALGVTHFIGMLGRVEDLRSTRLFAEKVLPAFR